MSLLEDQQFEISDLSIFAAQPFLSLHFGKKKTQKTKKTTKPSPKQVDLKTPRLFIGSWFDTRLLVT